MKGQVAENQKLQIHVEDIEEIDISILNNSYHTLYKRCGEEDENYKEENVNNFHQIIYDLDIDVCMFCGCPVESKDHTNCEDVIITEEELINIISDVTNHDSQEQKILLCINDIKYLV